MRLLASVEPQLAHGLVLSSALAAWATAAASPNISTTGNGEGSLGMGRELVRLMAHGSVRSSALALGRVLA